MNRLKTLKPLAKFLSYILERNPYEFGLVPDKNGYVKIKELIKAIVEEEGWGHIKKSNLDDLIYSLPDPPIEIEENLVRAKNGIKYQAPVFADNLPKEVFTTIRQKAHAHVLKKGINPDNSDYLILSSEKEIAEKIGKRRDNNPIILTINTSIAENAGVFFFATGESLYLAKHIPVDCFTAPPLPVQKNNTGKNLKAKKKKSVTTPVSDFPEVDATITKTSYKRDKTSWKENKKKLRRQETRNQIE